MGPELGHDFGEDVALSPEGDRAFVTGWSRAAERPRWEAVVVAVDTSSEARVWSARHGDADLDVVPNEVVTDPDGARVFVTATLGRMSRSWADPARIAEVSVASSGFAVLAFDAATGDAAWTRTFAGVHDFREQREALAVTPDGRTVLVAGEALGGGFLVLALDAETGAERWRHVARNPGVYAEAATALAVSPDGASVVVTGALSEAPGPHLDPADPFQPYDRVAGFRHDLVTIGLDAATGEPRWRAEYDGLGGDDRAFAVAVDPTGERVYVAGGSDDPEPKVGLDILSEAVLLAYDLQTGARLWSHHRDARGEDAAFAVASDGTRVFVSGWSRNGTGFARDHWQHVEALEAETGRLEWAWEAWSGGSFSSWPYRQTLRLAPDASALYLAGEHRRDPNVFALDPSAGALAWQYRHPDRGWSIPASGLEVAPDGRLFVASTLENADRRNDVSLLGVTPEGLLDLVHAYSGPARTGTDVADHLVLALGGEVAVMEARLQKPGGRWDVHAIAYDVETGAERWMLEIPNATTVGLAASPDGQTVYVATRALTGDPHTLQLRAVDAASGALAWNASHSFAPATAAGQFAVTPDGSGLLLASATGGDLRLTRFDAFNGAHVWTVVDPTSPERSEWGAHLALEGTGARAVLVASSTTPYGVDDDVYVVVFDLATGAVEWSMRWDGPTNSHDRGDDAAFSPDGRTLHVLGTVGPNPRETLALLRLDADDGSLLGVGTHGGRQLWGERLVAHPDGTRVYATASVGNSLVAFDATSGEVVCTGAGGNPSDLVLHADEGLLFAAGGFYSQNGLSLTAYRADTCERVWDEHYAGELRSGRTRALAVTPDGQRALVAGNVLGEGTSSDATTVAYKVPDPLTRAGSAR